MNAADEIEPVGHIAWVHGTIPRLAVYECPVCLCLTRDLAGHKKQMEHGR